MHVYLSINSRYFSLFNKTLTVSNEFFPLAFIARCRAVCPLPSVHVGTGLLLFMALTAPKYPLEAAKRIGGVEHPGEVALGSAKNLSTRRLTSFLDQKRTV